MPPPDCFCCCGPEWRYIGCSCGCHSGKAVRRPPECPGCHERSWARPEDALIAGPAFFVGEKCQNCGRKYEYRDLAVLPLSELAERMA